MICSRPQANVRSKFASDANRYRSLAWRQMPHKPPQSINQRSGVQAFAQKRALAPAGLRTVYRIRDVRVQAEAPKAPKEAQEVDDLDLESESTRKARYIEELRGQEKFMMVGTGEADCLSCGYKYDPKNGDSDYPVAPGTKFQNLPSDWGCPVCGAAKPTFQVQEKEIAGFAVNQQYGLGTNTMTSGQKSLLIYGSLAIFFLLFLAGYFLE